ncbi:MAG: putative patatin [Holophagaceae bacterium]|nr:putative patatin [Holophagaceae bacterium]
MVPGQGNGGAWILALFPMLSASLSFAQVTGERASAEPPSIRTKQEESLFSTQRFAPGETHELREGIALSLSGGGYRALLFHLGVLWRLNELGVLRRLDEVSSVSGGSMMSAILAMHWNELRFGDSPVADNFKEAVADPALSFANVNVDVAAVLKGALLPFYDATDATVSSYEKTFRGKTLQDLPLAKTAQHPEAAPRFTFNATNYASGVLVRMNRDFLWDYRVGKIDRPAIPLAKVVAASAGFPPVLSPLVLKIPRDTGTSFIPSTGDDLQKEPYTSKLVLADGGVYDNLGVETLWKSHKRLLVSDAGKPFLEDPRPWTNWFGQLFRVRDIDEQQGLAMRKRVLMVLFSKDLEQTPLHREGTYLGITLAPNDRSKLDAQQWSKPWDRLDEVPTRLKKMPEALQQDLVNWGYFVCDSQIKSFAAGFPARQEAAFHWPFPRPKPVP